MHCIDVDMTDLPSVGGTERMTVNELVQGLSVLTTKAMTDSSTDSAYIRSSVLVVVVTTIAECCLPQADILKIVTTCVGRESKGVTVSLCGVIAVVSPKGILSDSIVGPHW